jgi:hypothetical protein
MKVVDPVQEAIAVVLNVEGVIRCGDVDGARSGPRAVLKNFGKHFVDSVAKKSL